MQSNLNCLEKYFCRILKGKYILSVTLTIENTYLQINGIKCQTYPK